MKFNLKEEDAIYRGDVFIVHETPYMVVFNTECEDEYRFCVLSLSTMEIVETYKSLESLVSGQSGNITRIIPGDNLVLVER